MKYRKKPVVIEAVQWTGKNFQEILNFVAETEGDNARSMLAFHQNKLHIKTLESGDNMHVLDKKDWVIRGIKLEYYGCKPDIFEQTYEKVEEGE